MNRSLKAYVSVLTAVVIAFLAAYQGFGEAKTAMSTGITKQRRQIVLDAGHGGQDGGALGADGTKESGINLAIALDMRDMLSMLGYDVILTRDSDISIHDSEADTVRKRKVSDMKNRLKIIECHPDCILISIHQNKFSQSKYNGAQVFYSANNEKSIVYAQSIQDSIIALLQNDNDRQAKSMGSTSYIMKNSTVPSVLVECGFLSNAQELEKLKNEEYRQKMAFAIVCGFMAADVSC